MSQESMFDKLFKEVRERGIDKEFDQCFNDPSEEVDEGKVFGEFIANVTTLMDEMFDVHPVTGEIVEKERA